MRGEFDAVIACYHDQGLIPVKLVAFGRAVNVTLGLPIVRTSVDHGTAFDIAGQGIADPSSLVHAVLLAASLAARRRRMDVARRSPSPCIVAFYAVLGLVSLAPEAVYSGDIGVKYVQAPALVQQRFASLDIPYPGQFLDPDRAFFPLRPPFVMTTGGETQAIFPPVSALLQAVAVGAAGFRGMIALSIVAAAVVLVASCALAPAAQRLAVAIAVGLGGPLWFYAVSGWEHAPAIAFSTAAFAWAWRWPAAVAWRFVRCRRARRRRRRSAR